jgi:hypothetical protein
MVDQVRADLVAAERAMAFKVAGVLFRAVCTAAWALAWWHGVQQGRAACGSDSRRHEGMHFRACYGVVAAHSMLDRPLELARLV